VLLVATALSYVFAVLINYLASQGSEGALKFIRNTTGALSDKYYLEVTPSGWTFSIWGFIYTWQFLWICYSLSIFCRVQAPLVLGPLFCALYIASCFCNAGWMITFGMEDIVTACVLLFGIVICLYGTLAVVYVRVRSLEGTDKFPKRDFIAVQCLVINGIAFYATWVSIASLLNLAMVLIYKHGVKQEDGCTLSLSILACEIVLWFVMDVAILSNMTKYTLSPWIVLIVALIGSLDKNYVAGKRNSVLTLVLLCVVGVLTVVRLGIFAHRLKKRRSSKLTDISLS